MSDKNIATSGDVYGTSDKCPRLEDPPNLNNGDLALSLDNINSNMGKMASLETKTDLKISKIQQVIRKITNDQCAYSKYHWSRKQQNNG